MNTMNTNSTPAPEGFLRLSSKWLETNVAPEDCRFYNTVSHTWDRTGWAGMMLPNDLLGKYHSHDERKALDEFTMKELTESETALDLTQGGLPKADLTQPSAEVASERAEAPAVSAFAFPYDDPELYKAASFVYEWFAKRGSENWEFANLASRKLVSWFRERAQENTATITTLRAQLEANEEKGLTFWKELARMTQEGMNELKSRFEAKEAENDKLRAEVEHRTKQRDAFQNLFSEASEAFNERGRQIARLTADLDAVRKARDDYHNKACDIADQRDAAQARYGALELALRDLDTALAVMFWTSDDGMIQKLGEPDDAPDEKLGKAWAEARSLLAPSQQPENLKGGEEPLSQQPDTSHAPAIQSNPDTVIQGALSTGVSNPQPESPIPSGVGQPSRPEPVKAGECPICGALEVEANHPRTFYACGSSDYDQRPGTFIQSARCVSPIASEGKATEGEG